MAAARSTLLEGLEDISEEEQLRMVLEMSKYDTSDPSNNAHLGATNIAVDSASSGINNLGATNMSVDSTSSFEDWIRTPAEQRLQLIMDPMEAENKEETVDRRVQSIIGAAENSNGNDIVNNTETVNAESNSDIYNSDNEDDEEIKRVLEESKRATFISEEEKTNLAIELSKREARNNMTTLEEQLQEAEEQLKEAIKLSMEEMVLPTGTGDTRDNQHNTEPSVQRPSSSQDTVPGRQICPPSDSSSPRRPSQRQSRPVSINNEIRTVSSSSSAASSPRPGPMPPPPPPSYQATSEQTLSLTEEQQLEMALRQSQEDPTSMTEEDQLQYVLQLSRSESAQTLPPYTSWTEESLPITQNSSRSRNTSGHNQLGARPRVLQPLPATSNTSGYSQLGARPREDQSSPDNNPLAFLETNRRTIEQTPGSPRYIILDAGNICYQMGNNEAFDLDGLKIAIKWFMARGHEHILAILPESRKNKLLKEGRRQDVDVLNSMEKMNLLRFSNSKRTDQKSWDTYDDILMVESAAKHKGIVVTRDHYRDLLKKYNDHLKDSSLRSQWPFYRECLEQIRNR